MEIELTGTREHKAHCRHKLAKFIISTTLKVAMIATTVCVVRELEKIREHVKEIERRRN